MAEKSTFWTKEQSVVLSLVCTRVLIGAAFAVAALLHLLLLPGGYAEFTAADAGALYKSLPHDRLAAFVLCGYLCLIPALIALFSLNKLLANLRKARIFVTGNVKCLRVISWCCFAIAIITLCMWTSVSYLLIFGAALAAFFGILMRVVKNVIEAACVIKDENDFTI